MMYQTDWSLDHNLLAYKSLQSDAEKLATKWSKTGLLEGLEGSDKTNMSMILENQAKQLVQESSLSGGGVAGGGGRLDCHLFDPCGHWKNDLHGAAPALPQCL